MIEIQKVKIKPGNLLNVEYRQLSVIDGEAVNVGDFLMVGGYPAADSLIDAFEPLTLHFAMLTECIDEGKMSREDFDEVDALLEKHVVLKNMSCTKFVISGSNNEVLTLCGTRKTRYGKAVNMNGQLNNYNQAECPYEFADMLRDHIDALKAEVARYVNGHGKTVQLELFAAPQELAAVE